MRRGGRSTSLTAGLAWARVWCSGPGRPGGLSARHAEWPSAAAVGAAATSAVVTGIVWIIASDGLFAVVTERLGI